MTPEYEVTGDAPMFSLSGMSHDQFVSFARRVLERAGVHAQVEVSLNGVDEEDELPSHSVSVVTDRPYEAWRALTHKNDAAMERSGPSSITERFFGVDVTIDAY